MSFSFSNFNLQSIQDSISKVDFDSISKSFLNVNPGKTVSEYSEHLKESIQPLTSKTQQLISTQLQQVQQLAAGHANPNIEASELPEDYLVLEKNCDLLLKLFTDLIHYTNDTYGTLSYDYPPGNSAITKIKDVHVGSMISNKFNQLKNVSTPQEMEKLLLGQSATPPAIDSETVEIQVTSPQLPKTLYGQIAQIASRNGGECAETNDKLSFALLQISSAYMEIGSARLEQDKQIMNDFNHKLVSVLNEKFIKVNELRKKVYGARMEFDLVRSQVGSDDEENEELISKEDDLVAATELAVGEMRKLLNPAENVNLLKVFLAAQKEFFEMASKRMGSLLLELEKADFKDDDE